MSFPTRFPHQALFRRNTTTAMRPHINQDIIDQLPSVPQIQRICHLGCFDIGLCVVSVCYGETVTNEHRAQTLPLMARGDAEEMENWLGEASVAFWVPSWCGCWKNVGC